MALLAGALYAVTPFTMEISPGTLNMVKFGYVTIRMALIPLSLAVICAMVFLDGFARSFVGKIGNPSYRWWRAGNIVAWGVLAVAAAALVIQFAFEHRREFVVIDRKLDGHFLLSVVVAECLVIAGLLFLLARRDTRRRAVVLVVCLLAGSSAGAGYLGARWHAGFAEHYDRMFHTGVFSFLEFPGRAPAKHAVGEDGAASFPVGRPQDSSGGAFGIAGFGETRLQRVCAFVPRSYPLAGSRRQFELWQAHDTPAQPERFASQRELLEYLAVNEITIVALAGAPDEWNAAEMDRWSEGHPGVLTTFWEDNYVLMRVDQNRLNEALASEEQP